MQEIIFSWSWSCLKTTQRARLQRSVYRVWASSPDNAKTMVLHVAERGWSEELVQIGTPSLNRYLITAHLIIFIRNL